LKTEKKQQIYKYIEDEILFTNKKNIKFNIIKPFSLMLTDAGMRYVVLKKYLP